jgi:flagellar basal body-associated protein FliL
MKKEAKIKKSNKTLAVVLIVAAFVLILSLTIAFFMK